MPAPWVHPGQGVPRDGRDVYRHVAGAKEFGIEAGQPIVDFAVSQARKQKVVDEPLQGPDRVS